MLIGLAFLVPACGGSIVSEKPRIDPVDAGLSQTPERPRHWPAEAGFIPQAIVEYRWEVDRTVGNACVDRFIAYRDSVEERDAILRDDADPKGEGAAGE
jgi:hypothetical protein